MMILTDKEIGEISLSAVTVKDAIADVRAVEAAMQAKLDALQKQEPIGWLHFDGAEERSGKFPWVLMVNQEHQTIVAKTKEINLYAAPVVAEPLTEEQRLEIAMQFVHLNWEDSYTDALDVVIKAVERAHNIGGQP